MDRDDEQILSLDEDIDERQVQPFAASIYDVSHQENDSNSIGIGGGNFDSEQAGNDELRLLQAQVFIEDAAMYRAVDHKVDTRSLKLYRLYHSRPFSMFRTFVIVLLHLLAFFEFPSSLTWTSDIRTRGERVNLPCGLTEAIEFFCFMFFICDIVLKERVYGYHHLVKNRWIIAEMAVISVSLVDWSVSISLGCKDAAYFRTLADSFINLLSAMQNSLMRRRLGQRAAFEALKHKSMNMMHVQDAGPSMDEEHSHTVSVRDLKAIISRSNIGQEMKIILIDTIAQGFVQDQMLSWNNFLSVLRMMEMDKSQKEIMNFLFILYYMVEQGLILACMGFRRYRYSWANIYDGSIVLLLLISEIITVALYGFPFFSRSEVENNITLWNIVRFINILIMFRVLRIIWHIKAMAIVAHTLLDLVKNLQSFGGILIVIYYFFAMLGMELFQNKITYNPGNGSVHAGIGNGSYIKPANMTCGTYEQLDYWANNFDDFANFIMKWDRFYDSQQRSRAVQPSMGDGGGQRRSRALSQSMKMDTLTI
ncbi:TPC2-like protein [Mya arenaria]|uniref:TPC2-like protein n=1 Tax=Mya arenaria TaxID=6604 RepID=A0ABY7EJ51_MYAAR|nr:TPC2-like protein [Mya arenaria]